MFDQGVVLRARKTSHDQDDSVVKLRPVEPARIPLEWATHKGFEVEMDRVGEHEVISARLKAVQAPGEIDRVVGGARALRKLFSEDQEALIREFGPADVAWDDLVVMGPIAVSTWRRTPQDFEYEVTVERWVLPDSSDLVELSIKVSPPEASRAAEAFAALLADRGLGIDDEQQTKTRGALMFFTRGVGFA